MSIRIYLDQEVKTEILKNEKIDFINSNCFGYEFKGLLLQTQDEDLYFEIIDPMIQNVPKVLKSQIERVTLRETFRIPADRECGVYVNNSAQAELRIVDNRPLTYNVSMVGKNMEDVKNLLQLIKIGEIRPTMSYQNRQGGLSQAELEKELEATKEESATLCDALKNAKSELVATKREIDLAKSKIAHIEKQRAELEKELEKTSEEKAKLAEELEKAQMNEDIAYKNLREKQEEATRLNARISAVEKYIEHKLESGVFALIKKSSVANTLRDLLCL